MTGSEVPHAGETQSATVMPLRPVSALRAAEAEQRTAERDRLDELLVQVGRGDRPAFELLYDHLSARVFGICRRVLRDPAQAEEVAQEVLLEVWRRAARFDPSRGSALSWAMTIAHARAVDRVRSAQASTERDVRYATQSVERDVDVVAEAVQSSLERRQVQRCLSTLTDLQRESINLAYYSGYTQAEVALALQAPLGTVKTRLRDGLIRLRDCLGVSA